MAYFSWLTSGAAVVSNTVRDGDLNRGTLVLAMRGTSAASGPLGAVRPSAAKPASEVRPMDFAVGVYAPNGPRRHGQPMDGLTTTPTARALINSFEQGKVRGTRSNANPAGERLLLRATRDRCRAAPETHLSRTGQRPGPVFPHQDAYRRRAGPGRFHLHRPRHGNPYRTAIPGSSSPRSLGQAPTLRQARRSGCGRPGAAPPRPRQAGPAVLDGRRHERGRDRTSRPSPSSRTGRLGHR